MNPEDPSVPNSRKADRTETDRVDDLLQRSSLLHSELEDEEPPVPAAVDAETRESHGERFQIVERLGAGGTAEVWKAYDSTLQRFVALKFLSSTDPVLAERFLHEARAQAKVHHGNVCQVHEVDRQNGRPCIVMQYIAGANLRQASAEMTLEERIRVTRMIAEGVQAAHESGLIHRDLKPGNILVERTPDGWQPFVLDFGLAQDLETPGTTRTGTIIGSPHYMSPEQVRGAVRDLDRRTDIYSLGAILYELLCGHPPFPSQNSAEVLVQILQVEPATLRGLKPEIPRDLEAIALKCLEKERHLRYPSARALIEDLDHYLRGEPVTARIPGWKERLSRTFRKHRTTSAIGAAALAAVLVLSILWVRERWNAAERARAAQQFGQEVESIRGEMRYAYALPLHNINDDRSRVRKRMKQMEDRMQQLGGPALAFGNYAIGSAHLALYEYEPARKRLKSAWDAGVRTPEAAYSLGVLYGALYQQNLEVEQRGGAKISEKRSKELEVEFLAPAREFLKSARSGEVASPEYLEGLIAFYDHRFDPGIEHAVNALRSAPGLYEARKLEGDIHASVGMEERNLDHPQEAIGHFRKALAAYETAAGIARSDPQVLLARCLAEIQLLETTLYLQHSLPDAEETCNACESALQADPESAEAHFALSRIHHRVGHFHLTHGEEFRADLSAAIREGEEAVRLNPENPGFYEFLGLAHWRVAQDQMEKGEDPLESLGRMATVFRKMVRVNPAQQEGYSGLGIAAFLVGEHSMETGKNALPHFEEALGNYRKAMQVNPGWEPALNGVGFSLVGIAEWNLQHGKDPRPYLEEAVPLYSQSIRMHPLDSIPRYFLANAWLIRGIYESEAGLESTTSWNEAVQNAKEAVRLDPNSSDAGIRLGTVYAGMAQYGSGEDPEREKLLQMAIAASDRAITINPRSSHAWRRVAAVHLARADFLLKQGQSPVNSLGAAALALDRANGLNSNHYELYLLQGGRGILEGTDLLRRGKSPKPAYEAASAALDRAGSLNPRSAEVWMRRAELAVRLAQWSEKKEWLTRASKAAARALELNPLLKRPCDSLLREIAEM